MGRPSDLPGHTRRPLGRGASLGRAQRWHSPGTTCRWPHRRAGPGWSPELWGEREGGRERDSMVKYRPEYFCKVSNGTRRGTCMSYGTDRTLYLTWKRPWQRFKQLQINDLCTAIYFSAWANFTFTANMISVNVEEIAFKSLLLCAGC